MENINELANALSKCQGEIKNAVKDSENPFFRSKYADLTSVWNAAREPLKNNGLAVTQVPDVVDGSLVLRTILMHSSGQSISGIMPLTTTDKTTPQQLGSMITYLKRYALSAMVGVATEDDDGNAANETHIVAPKKNNAQKFASTKPGETDELKGKVKDFVKELEMSESSAEVERAIQSHDKLIQDVKEKLPTEWSTRMYEKIGECRLSFKT